MVESKGEKLIDVTSAVSSCFGLLWVGLVALGSQLLEHNLVLEFQETHLQFRLCDPLDRCRGGCHFDHMLWLRWC